jgi:hypothetical protein
MTPEHVLKYMKSPKELNASHTKELEQLVRQFPYFQPAYLLLSIASKQQDTATFQKYFKRTAVTVTNRKQLHALLHVQEPKSIVNLPEEIQKATNLIESIDSKKEKDSIALTSSEVIYEISEAAKQEERLKLIEERLAEIQNEKKSDLLKEKANDLEIELIEHEKIQNQPIKESPRSEEFSQNTYELEQQNEKETLEKLTAAEKEIKESPEYQLETEIEKSLVNAFVEKAVLKTHQANQKEEKLEDGSFAQWLQFFGKITSSNTESIVSETSLSTTNTDSKSAVPSVNEEKEKRAQKMALIDKIIEKNPSHIRLDQTKTKLYTAEKSAKESLLESEHLVTETLAKIYALQGNINKAIRAYEILSLKYPNKSAYFASLIKELKKN